MDRLKNRRSARSVLLDNIPLLGLPNRDQIFSLKVLKVDGGGANGKWHLIYVCSGK